LPDPLHKRLYYMRYWRDSSTPKQITYRYKYTTPDGVVDNLNLEVDDRGLRLYLYSDDEGRVDVRVTSDRPIEDLEDVDYCVHYLVSVHEAQQDKKIHSFAPIDTNYLLGGQ
jgi:hypothetical protein